MTLTLKLRMAGPGVERNGHRKLEADGRGEPGAKRGVPLLRPIGRSCVPRSVLRRRSHNPQRPDSPRAAPREQNAFCSSPKGCRKAEKCGDSRSRTFRPGGNAGVRRKGQRVRESSTERTHNARRYATLPGPAAAGFRRGPARLGAASVARSMTPDSPTSRTTRSGTRGGAHGRDVGRQLRGDVRRGYR